jgi:hypothetical protein
MPDLPGAPDLDQVTRELLDEWGIDARRIRPVVSGLGDGSWRTIGDLVRDHGVSRGAVEAVAGRLEPWLERHGPRVRARAEHREALTAAWAAAPSADLDSVEATMTALLRALPASDRSLDHVPATPSTAVARARFLAETFDLAGATVLCLGDHDLTSLALAQLCPSADVRVADVDERILAFVAAAAAERGWRVTPVFADLRVELPPSLRESADLVFTDPPYAPAGMRLFLARGLESLRRRDVGRLVFCYGFGERHPALGLNVQAVFHGLHLVAEAILPGFNRYAGAEALGGVSSLYVCRPTRRSWAAAARPRPGDRRIYSQGEHAETAAPSVLSAEVLDEVRRLAGEAGRPVLVGDGWPGDRPALSMRRYLEDIRAGGARPPFTGPAHAGVVAVNLHPHLGGYLPRLLLSAAARRLIAVAPPEAAGGLTAGRVAELVGVRYGVSQVADGPPIVVADRREAAPADAVDRALRLLLDRPAATLGSAWREAIIAAAAADGGAVTKNQARAAIAATAIGARWGRCHVSELPLHALRDLRADIERTLGAAG